MFINFETNRKQTKKSVKTIKFQKSSDVQCSHRRSQSNNNQPSKAAEVLRNSCEPVTRSAAQGSSSARDWPERPVEVPRSPVETAPERAPTPGCVMKTLRRHVY